MEINIGNNLCNLLANLSEDAVCDIFKSLSNGIIQTSCEHKWSEPRCLPERTVYSQSCIKCGLIREID